MKKIKTLLLSLVFLFSLFSFNDFSSAKQVHDGSKTEKLTKLEKSFLKDVTGHTEEEIDMLPLEIAKQLVEDKAVIQDSKTETFSFEENAGDVENEENTSGTLTTMGTISSSTMTLAGTVYKVTSDRSGYDKFYIYGNFRWLKSPFYELVDKMTFGFPSSAGFFLPTSDGAITQHQHRYSQDPQGNGTWVDYAIDYTPNMSMYQHQEMVQSILKLNTGTQNMSVNLVYQYFQQDYQ
ncbi:hypothetical protein GGR02_000886 [Anoxybacillus voinovskiensis]|uniref:Uncharacterized protein n=1 Tax=Anoxybacteroides voinovskiense TaxID=230470 RepID=A0A840DNB2_9BACL|nr:hypothetical protein [Anoxybacillus voinovskiensis]MBB4073125.1 hypothetical protein [Anoxybacillus voinovskiensis]GGJ70472.1 hypothetical protein GCM10008982_19810 [Anoxybacillus voinovskiensis]